jgi:hypothetical protein
VSDLPIRVPPDIETKIVQLRRVLEVQGSLQHRADPDRRRTWRIRYRVEDHDLGCRKHRSIPLGHDEAVARSAWDLVSQWRAQRAKQAEEAATEAETVILDAKKRRLQRQVIQLSVPGGRDIRRKVGREFDEAVSAGARDLFQFVWSLPLAHAAPRRGRPRKSRLW